MRLLSKGRTAMVAGLMVLAIGSAACSSDGSSTVADGGSTPNGDSGAMSNQPFGAACSAVPTDGAGSFDGMAQDPVATAASNNPVLSTLVTAVTEAELVDTLNGSDDITVFAPINDAFDAMDKKTMDAAMADPKGLLTTVLTYHVVAGRLSPEDLAGTHETLEGSELEVTGSGEDFTVNGSAAVVCGNVQTANATVYLIDAVLMPPDA